MPALTNIRRERFARFVADGMSVASAYQAAGFRPSAQNANTLRHTPIVDSRIQELLAERADSVAKGMADAVQKAALTKAWVLETTIALAQEARLAGAYGPAAKCLELLGREVYAFIERKEIGAPGDFDGKSEDELIALVQDAAREIRAGRKGRAGTGSPQEPESVH